MRNVPRIVAVAGVVLACFSGANGDVVITTLTVDNIGSNGRANGAQVLASTEAGMRSCDADDDCDDGNCCTIDECIDPPGGTCRNTFCPSPFGDIVHWRACEDGAPPQPDLDDIICIIDGFAAGDQWLTVCPCGDIRSTSPPGCEPDGQINLDDIIAVLDSFADSPPCPAACSPNAGMAQIPEGEFLMGDHDDEVPDWLVHAVYLDSFYMGIYEVTNQQYCDYLNSAYTQGLIEVNGGVVYGGGGKDSYCSTYPTDSHSRIHWDEEEAFTITSGKEDHPMVVVSWYGAAAYSNWRSEQTGRDPSYNLSTWECDFDANGYRLPTEAEWEYAARGGEHDPYYRYPWGDTIEGSNANYYGTGDPFEGTWPETTPVGYYDGGQTPSGSNMGNGYGLYDMAGNVWEWCNDWYSSTYYSSSPYDNPTGPASGTRRVFRGGSWYSCTGTVTCAVRNSTDPGFMYNYFGFRLVLDLD